MNFRNIPKKSNLRIFSKYLNSKEWMLLKTKYGAKAETEVQNEHKRVSIKKYQNSSCRVYAKHSRSIQPSLSFKLENSEFQ